MIFELVGLAFIPALTFSEIEPVVGFSLPKPMIGVELAEMPQIAPRTQGKYKTVGNGQCVPFVQQNGFKSLTGNASEWYRYVNASIGWPGYAVVLNEGSGHVALVIGNDGGYNIVEQNGEGESVEITSKNPKISYRTIPYDYPNIVGFIKNIPTDAEVRRHQTVPADTVNDTQ